MRAHEVAFFTVLGPVASAGHTHAVLPLASVREGEGVVAAFELQRPVVAQAEGEAEVGAGGEVHEQVGLHGPFVGPWRHFLGRGNDNGVNVMGLGEMLQRVEFAVGQQQGVASQRVQSQRVEPERVGTSGTDAEPARRIGVQAVQRKAVGAQTVGSQRIGFQGVGAQAVGLRPVLIDGTGEGPQGERIASGHRDDTPQGCRERGQR